MNFVNKAAQLRKIEICENVKYIWFGEINEMLSRQIKMMCLDLRKCRNANISRVFRKKLLC